MPVEPPVPVDCSSIIDFLDDEVMALSHTASFGETCVTIETLVHFGTDGMAEELDPEGNVLGTFAYTVTEVDGQCALASTASDCEVQLLSFDGDESAMIMSLNGAEATLTPTYCPFAPELGDVSVTSGATALANAFAPDAPISLSPRSRRETTHASLASTLASTRAPSHPILFLLRSREVTDAFVEIGRAHV